LRRGCISLGTVKCDECGRGIVYPERYLVLEVKDGKTLKLCVTCSESRGYLKDKPESEALFNLSDE
jgi:sulfur relay (sulfurtransferase) complex TusBCD TusD component (DsrE family)